jgi:HAD superfamily hydrolase (TIGR01509 family)
MALKLACFDLDGLLVDTEPHYYESTRAVWAEYGKGLTKEYYARTWIIRGTTVAVEVEKAGIPDKWEAVLDKIRARYRERVEADLRLMPHARETLEAARKIGKTALVTNTPPFEVGKILDRSGIAGLLDFIVSRDKYERAKPEPDCYLAAMRMAGTGPGETVALEDSPRGMRAAIAAGVPVIAVVNEMTRYEQPVGALMVLNSLKELDLGKVADSWPPAPVR